MESQIYGERGDAARSRSSYLSLMLERVVCQLYNFAMTHSDEQEEQKAKHTTDGRHGGKSTHRDDGTG